MKFQSTIDAVTASYPGAPSVLFGSFLAFLFVIFFFGRPLLDAFERRRRRWTNQVSPGAFPPRTSAVHREPQVDEGRPPRGFRTLEGAPIPGLRLTRPPTMARGYETAPVADDNEDEGSGDICGLPRRDPDDNNA